VCRTQSRPIYQLKCYPYLYPCKNISKEHEAKTEDDSKVHNIQSVHTVQLKMSKAFTTSTSDKSMNNDMALIELPARMGRFLS